MRYRAGELAADRLIHLTGTLAGIVGSLIMVGVASDVADRSTFLASLVYSVCLLAMLGCSAAYNLASKHPGASFCADLIMPRSF
jgi:hemolysin III